MNKCKIEKKSGMTSLIVKGQKGQQIGEYETNAINGGTVKCALPFTVIPKGRNFKLAYNLSGLVTLKVFFKNPLNRQLVIKVLVSILNGVKAIEAAQMNLAFVLLTLDYVMINPLTQDVFFVYVPVRPIESDVSLKSFLLSITQSINFMPGEDAGFIRRFAAELNGGPNFSSFNLEKCIRQICEEQGGTKIQCPHCFSENERGNAFCASCGKSLPAGDESGVYSDSSGGQGGASDATTVLSAPTYGETVVLSEQLAAAYYPHIIQRKTQQQAWVDKPDFLIGTDASRCDFVISDNSAVSRRHASIISRGERYFVLDRNSTNRTYINDKVIPSGKEVEITSGVTLRFGNEEFEFHID